MKTCLHKHYTHNIFNNCNNNNNIDINIFINNNNISNISNI